MLFITAIYYRTNILLAQEWYNKYMVIQHKDGNYGSRIVLLELLRLFKASQFTLVYTLNIALVFFSASVIFSAALVNSGGFFISILNFFIKIFNIPEGDYRLGYSLSNFFFYAYHFATFIVYLIERWWRKKTGVDLYVKAKYKMILIPVVVCLMYGLVAYYLSSSGGKKPLGISWLLALAMLTILVNYYYLALGAIIKRFDHKIKQLGIPML